MELEKLALYKGPVSNNSEGSSITVDDAMACIGDTAALEDEIADVRRRVRVLRSADEDHGAVALHPGTQPHDRRVAWIARAEFLRVVHDGRQHQQVE